jgi:hypothetical protein
MDATGRLTLPALPAAAGIQNLIPAAVMDMTQTEGQSLGELLTQIWIELKIANQYHFDLPKQLQSGTAFLSDEPDAFRNDPTFIRN